jgi:hypothetical protein
MNDKVIEMAREAGFNVKMFKPPVITAQHSNGSWVSVGEELKAFADLIRADEREACARDADWCIQNHLEHLIPERITSKRIAPYSTTLSSLLNSPAHQNAKTRSNKMNMITVDQETLTRMIMQVVEIEREACAKVCESNVWSKDVAWWKDATKSEVSVESSIQCAAAIRARGNT